MFHSNKVLFIFRWVNIQTNENVHTDIFSQGHKKPLARGEKSLWEYSAKGKKRQPQISHSADLGKLSSKCFPQGKV